mmetsp:Transcript_29026/g.69099  ORF Transcript_29026/g.69099 Transcript_29026/m.69099 type:complete len:446 (+) Transcript_29026:82-1419(+)
MCPKIGWQACLRWHLLVFACAPHIQAHSHVEFHGSIAPLGSDSSGVTSDAVPHPYHRYTAESLMRRGGTIDAIRLCKLAVMAAVLGSLAAICIPGQKRIFSKSPKEKPSASAYPWQELPPAEAVAAAGATFSDSVGAMRKALLARKMQPKSRGSVLIGGGEQASEALIVQRVQGARRPFAAQLRKIGMQDLAPVTLQKASELRKALGSSSRSGDFAGAWLLKHTLAAGDVDGVTCFKGADELLEFWESMPKSTRCSYFAQADIQHPLVSNGFHIKAQAFVLVLDTGRWFLHREQLVLNTTPYDAANPRPQKPRVSAARGTASAHYVEVWPRLQKALSTAAQHKSFGRRWLGEKQPGMGYQLFVVDVAIDQDKKPWLLDMFPMPEVPCKASASSVWEEVMEDTCELLVTPLLWQLRPRAEVGKAPDSGKTALGSETSGFVEISEPH